MSCRPVNGYVAVLFALGLMAKPMLVTLPFVLLLLDYWPLGRLSATGDCPDFRVSENGTVPFDAAAAGPPPARGSGLWNRMGSSVSWRVVAEKIPLLC